VSELLRDNLWRDTYRQRQRRRRMPQIIEPYIREPGSLQDWLEVLVDEAIHIHRSSKLRYEDQADGFRPLFGIDNRVSPLEFLYFFGSAQESE